MKPFKIRCSKIGAIMSMPRSKADKEAGLLSLTAKSYVEEHFKEQFFGRKREFSNRYTIKGIEAEDVSIALYGEMTNQALKKNEEHFENDFCTGTPDLVLDDSIIDIKTLWNLWTFGIFDEKIKEKNYWWQLQGYMWLCNKQKAVLAYCLVDTPDSLIEKEYNMQKWGVEESEQEALLDKIVKDLNFGDIDKKYKVKTFEIERDDEAIEQIKEQVEKCRNYQQTLNNFLTPTK